MIVSKPLLNKAVSKPIDIPKPIDVNKFKRTLSTDDLPLTRTQTLSDSPKNEPLLSSPKEEAEHLKLKMQNKNQ